MTKYFIAGFLLAFFFDGISTILFYIVEWIKGIIALKITQCNVKINQLSSELEQQETAVIGFAIPDDNNEGDFDEDD